MLYVVSSIPQYKFKPILYRGEDAVYNFLTEILKVSDKISYIMHQNKEMILTDDKITGNDKVNFKNSTICHICENPSLGNRVRDHCHITGKYIGAAH